MRIMTSRPIALSRRIQHALLAAAFAIFSMSAARAQLATLYSFGSDPSDGSTPEGSLTLDNGTLYGTTYNGGSDDYGTVFSVPISGGSDSILYSFNGTDGANPQAGLTLSGTTLYGTETQGGLFTQAGSVWSLPETGGAGNLTTLYQFQGGADGSWPNANLVLVGSTLYGTTSNLGNDFKGVVFSLPTTGAPRPPSTALRVEQTVLFLMPV